MTDDRTPTPADETPLPPLDDARIDAIEHAVFARIDNDRGRRRVRRRGALVGAGAAAAIVVAAAVTTPIALAGLGSGTDEAVSGWAIEPAQARDSAELSGGDSDARLESSADGAMAASDAAGSSDQREIIANGSLTVAVSDVDDAASAVTTAAERAGGYVESMEVSRAGSASTTSTTGMDGDMEIYPYSPSQPGTTWIQLRVPADELTAVMDEVGDLGTVENSSVSRQDVTDWAIDVRARVEASETSVERLTALLAEASSVSDLIAAESALTDRQAILESYRQELASLENSVSMSSLSVSLSPEDAPTPDASGFGDGIAAGWNGLIATLNGIVIGIGFLLPWIAVAAVAGVLIWIIVRTTRARRRRGDTEPGPDGSGV